jgi:hypothetical protein
MVEYRHRYTNSMYKDDTRKELVKLVGRPHQVNLQNPDKVMIVEVFMVRDWRLSGAGLYEVSRSHH